MKNYFHVELRTLLIAAISCLVIANAGFAHPASPFGTTLREQVGVNIHFTDARPGEMQMLSDAGFGFVRMDFVWQDTEKQPGVYNFSAYDRLLANLEAHKMRALWILDYGNPLYDGGKQPYSDSARADFAAWAVAGVRHFAGHRILWEMWNEPNGSWSAPDYIKLDLTVAQALKKAEPSETFIGPAEAGTDVNFLNSCFKAGTLSDWQAVSVHPYRTDAPETARPEYAAIRAAIAAFEPVGADIPVISGEWGYSVMPNGHTYSFVISDDQQAAYFDREILTNAVDGIPLSIWYDWHNDSDNPSDTEGNFGLVRYPYHADRNPVYDPKPSYLAAKTMLGLLGNYEFSRVVPMSGPPDAILLSFKSRRDHRYAAYTTSSSPEQVTLPIPAGRYSVIGMTGDVNGIVNCGHQGLSVMLTADPQFIVRQ